MILPFSLELNDEPTFFVEKITQGLLNNPYVNNEVHKLMHKYKWPKNSHYSHPWSARADFKDKLHTMRTDEKNRWQPGSLIHFVVNNRTKKYWQFAPVLPCVSTQLIHIVHTKTTVKIYIDTRLYCVVVKGYYIRPDRPDTIKLQKLAENDGFETCEAFLQYFNTNWSGKIIHWTNLRY